jgi:hypothetical protein
MTIRVDGNSSYFTPAERPEEKRVRGILEYTWKITKGFARLFNLSFSLKDGQFNTGSLARYICEKYVSGNNPLQHKSQVKTAITRVLANRQPPDSLNDLIDAVLKSLAGKEVSEVLDLGTNPKQVETKDQYKKISTLFITIQQKKPLESKAGTPTISISQKLNAQKSIDLIRERTIGAAETLLSVTIFPKLREIKLPEPLAKIAKKPPSFETYVEFVTALRQLSDNPIPDTLQDWEVVLREATILGKLNFTIFPGLRDIELHNPLEQIIEKPPSLATYKEFVTTLRNLIEKTEQDILDSKEYKNFVPINAETPLGKLYYEFITTLRNLTKKTDAKIPDNVNDWEVVSQVAMALVKLYVGIFYMCADAQEKFHKLEDPEVTKGQTPIRHLIETMFRTKTNPLTYPLSDLTRELETVNARIAHLEQEQSQRKAPEKQPEVRKQERQQAEPKLATQQDPARAPLLKELRSAPTATTILRATLKRTYGAQAVSDKQLHTSLRVRLDDVLEIAQQKGDQNEVAKLQKLKDEEQAYQFGVEKLANDFVRTTKETLEKAIPRDELMALLSKGVTVEAILSLIFSPPFTMENCLKQSDPATVEQVTKTGDPVQIAKLQLKQDALGFLSDVLGNVYDRRKVPLQ